MGNAIELSQDALETIGDYVHLMQQGFAAVDRRFEAMQRNSTRWFTVLTVMVGLIGLSGIVLPLLP